MNNNQQSKHSRARNALFVLMSLLLSVLLWVYVTETQDDSRKQSYDGVLVRFDGEGTLRESRGLIISNPSATSARVTLTGSRRTLANLKDAQMYVTVDLSGITRTGNYSLSPSVTYPARTDTSSITMAETNPATISFYVDKLESKPVPVTGAFNGNAAEGYVAEPLQFSPATVLIYGPEQLLSQVQEAHIDVTRSEVDRTLTFESTFTLLDAEGEAVENDAITYDTSVVNVTLPISSVKDVDLVIDLVSGGGATEANVRWKLEPDYVTLIGDSETLSGLNSLSVAKIDLSQVVEDSFTETCRIVIPNDTEVVNGTKEATLTMDLVGLYRKSFTVEKSNISCINISEGYKAEIMNDSLQNVILRSPDERALESISDVDVRAVADLREYGTATGIITVPVRIYVNGNTNAGAVGEYKVYVDISEETE